MGKIEVTESDGRRYAKSAEDVIPQPEPSTPLDELRQAVRRHAEAVIAGATDSQAGVAPG